MGSHTSAKSIRLSGGNKQGGVWAAARQRVEWAGSAHKAEDKKIWRLGGVNSWKGLLCCEQWHPTWRGSFRVKQARKKTWKLAEFLMNWWIFSRRKRDKINSAKGVLRAWFVRNTSSTNVPTQANDRKLMNALFAMLSETEKESSIVPWYVLGKDENPPWVNLRRATARASAAELQTHEVGSIGVAAASGSGPGLQLLVFKEVTNQILLHSYCKSSCSTRDVYRTGCDLLLQSSSQLWHLADSGITHPPS